MILYDILYVFLSKAHFMISNLGRTILQDRRERKKDLKKRRGREREKRTEGPCCFALIPSKEKH